MLLPREFNLIFIVNRALTTRFAAKHLDFAALPGAITRFFERRGIALRNYIFVIME
jgi:hypothetical protein